MGLDRTRQLLCRQRALTAGWTEDSPLFRHFVPHSSREGGLRFEGAWSAVACFASCDYGWRFSWRLTLSLPLQGTQRHRHHRRGRCRDRGRRSPRQPEGKVVVSDWGWKGHGDATEIIARLPNSVWLMSVSEWFKPIERGGIKTTVGEYSISAVGRGPRALRHWGVAARAGVKTAAGIQFNNTCEIASLPYLPVMDLVAEHIHNLAPAGLSGMLIGWKMGGYPSPNLRLARRLMRKLLTHARLGPS